MGTWDTFWQGWGVVANSKGYSSAVISTQALSLSRCYVKVGDELRHARYHDARWDSFESLGGGRLRSDPVLLSANEVYGVGLEGQLVRNAWRATNGSGSWQGWQDLGAAAGALLGNPAVVAASNSRYVVVKGGDNRLYLRQSHDGGKTWDDRERDARLRGGQITSDPSAFAISEADRSPELVVTGRSMEGEMASISRVIGTSGTPTGSPWGEWAVAGNSRGYSSAVFVHDPDLDVVHCLVKVGDELRHARYHGGRWDAFASVDGGRFRSDPVVVVGHDNEAIEVYGAGLDGQLFRNIWPAHVKAWQGWKDLGRPVQGIVGTPSVETMHSTRFAVVKGSNNRLHLSYSNDGKSWAPWEQGDKLRPGQIRGDISTFIIDEPRRSPQLVVTGRSMENEMASISLIIT